MYAGFDFAYDAIYDHEMKSFIVGTNTSVSATPDTGKTVNSLLAGDAFRSVYRTGNLLFAGGRASIYRSSTNGATWDTIFRTNKQDLGAIYSIVENSKGKLFAGGHFGLITSNDRGETWFYPDELCKTMNIRSLFVSQNDILFVGTLGDGVWKSKYSTRVDEQININKNILVCRPNPAVDQTLITLPFSPNGSERLLISDLKGNAVTDYDYRFIDKEIMLTLSNISAGVYILSVTSDTFDASTIIRIIK
jgi:photosystem II stability/assembly factor-like uncharacterized protein